MRDLLFEFFAKKGAAAFNLSLTPLFDFSSSLSLAWIASKSLSQFLQTYVASLGSSLLMSRPVANKSNCPALVKEPHGLLSKVKAPNLERP